MPGPGGQARQLGHLLSGRGAPTSLGAAGPRGHLVWVGLAWCALPGGWGPGCSAPHPVWLGTLRPWWEISWMLC